MRVNQLPLILSRFRLLLSAVHPFPLCTKYMTSCWYFGLNYSFSSDVWLSHIPGIPFKSHDRTLLEISLWTLTASLMFTSLRKTHKRWHHVCPGRGGFSAHMWVIFRFCSKKLQQTVHQHTDTFSQLFVAEFPMWLSLSPFWSVKAYISINTQH